MPPKFKFNKEQIIDKALELVRKKGMDSLSARTLAMALESSPQPIFSYFENMDEVKNAVIKAVDSLYKGYIENEIKKEKFPIYKSMGMAYIRFAKQEKKLFKLLFMCERNDEASKKGEEELTDIIEIIMKSTGLSRESAKLFHLETWTFVHGIAAMTVTGFLNLEEELISDMLTDIFEGLKYRFEKRI